MYLTFGFGNRVGQHI